MAHVGQERRLGAAGLFRRIQRLAEKLLVLDEPVAGLDPIVTADLYALIQRINREDGITIIMVSHDIGAALQYATHILQVSGDNNFFGTVEEYRQSALGSLFLGKAGEGHA